MVYLSIYYDNKIILFSNSILIKVVGTLVYFVIINYEYLHILPTKRPYLRGKSIFKSKSFSKMFEHKYILKHLKNIFINLIWTKTIT